MTTLAKSTRAIARTTPRFTLQNPAMRRNLEGWLFASPWILGFILWTLGPMIASLAIAFTEWDLISSPQWVGLANITAMIRWPKPSA